MRRTRFAVLVIVAALCSLLGASSALAQAPAATIDAIDSAGSVWQPAEVTVQVGETVRWEFDQAQTVHNLKSTSTNWEVDTPIEQNQDPVDYTFTAPGTYSFVCEVHASTMTGSVTVEEDEPGDGLDNVLVFSKTAGFRHDSIPQGIAAIQELGADNGFEVDATEDGAQFTDANLAQYDAVIWLSTTGDVLTDTQQAAYERYIQAGGGNVGIHAAADTEYGWAWYGDMLGGYFRSHPPGTPTASVDIEDGDEPSTEGLPTRWTRTDEWYNYQTKDDPTPGGGGTDYSPRQSGVHVLATLDETTLDEQDGNATDDDHPISWCSEYDGGTSWYTGMGHTQGSFGEDDFLAHVLGGIQTAAGVAENQCSEPSPEPEGPPTAADFEKVTLDDDTSNPMELDIAPDGRVFYIERDGRVMVWKPSNEQTVQAGSVPVTLSQENGLIGIQLAPDFETSNHLYLAYSALPDSSNQNRVSRFTVEGDTIVPGSEQIIYTWQHQRAECCHTSGSLSFAPNGDLYISTGDNTNPFASDGFAPIDERPGRQAWDAQRTSANTDDANGKILRIHPLPGATGTPGEGTTYTIPAGNLYAPGTADTKPEVFAMGFRNPFRINFDPETGWLLLGDYGPDSGVTVADRGPQGSVEFNALTSAGNYGWPYCVRQNVPYNDYDFSTGQSGPKFNCDAPVNESPNNTGLTNLPAARPATMWMGYTETDTRFPQLGTGGAPTSGPRYHYDPDNPSQTKFPEYYDDEWFIGEWNNGWIKTATLDAQGNATNVRPFAIETGYRRPMDMDFGPDGSLYLIEWGSGFGGNNADSGIYRIDYIAGGRRPIAQATADPDNGPAPLNVQFSSEGSNDPDGEGITYAWDFDNDGTVDSTEANPSHTYDAPGTYNASLRVTDVDGQTGVDNVTVVVGNTRPVVTIEIPEDGQFAAFGDRVPYRLSVTDAEDGSTASGIDCEDVTLNVSLGHDEHAHELSEHTGCEGIVDTLLTSGHGDTANVFTVLEAVYTDEGATGSSALTGRAEVILNPKKKQAEFFSSTGRVPGVNPSGGTPGVQLENTTDEGGGSAIAFIEEGDYVSYTPTNLKDIDSVVLRIASGGAGGRVELRHDSPTGPLVKSVDVANTGGWQNWQDISVDLEGAPAGTKELFVVFRNETAAPGDGLMNLNWMEFKGKGAATTAAPEVSAAASPTSGQAPLEVMFDGTATDPEGEALTYEWDFGVAGTTDDTSTEIDPTYTYQRAGTYNARFTASDAQGGRATDTVQIRVTAPPDECPTGPLRSDEFEGDQLDTNRWTVLRPDEEHPFEVANGSLTLPIANGSMYGAGTTAKNLILQDTPEGEWEVTAKITTDPLTENYHQAGLRVYSDDNNWASVHMIHAGGNRDMEFIYEANGNPRNEGLDKLGGIPADSPTTYWVRITSDGTNLNASYSFDGDTFEPVGRPAPLSTFTNPQIGPAALSDLAPSVPDAHFDWIRFNPDGSTGGGGGGGGFVDDFNGSDLASPPWDVVRRDQNLTVTNGTLNIPAAPGDIYGGRNDAKNLVTRAMPGGAWEATAKLNFEGTAQYHQAGIMVYGDDANFTKFGRIAHTAAGDEKFEFIYENASTPRNEAADSTGNIAADFPDDFWVRMTSDGTNVTGTYSTDGTTWTPVGRPAPLPANAKIGMFAFSNDGTGNPVAAFDSFTLTGDEVGGGGGPVGPSRDDQFDGTSLDKDRWNAIVRENDAAYEVAGGDLTITTEPGDIYSGDTTPPPNNFILQSADHAGEDWVIETKIDSKVNGGYGQGGLIAYKDGDNYVKFDPIADAGQTRINRLELRTEVAGSPTGPATPPDPQVADGSGTVFWLKLTKSGTNYTGEYSRDGETWISAGTVVNAMEDPSFGLYAFGPQADGVGDTVAFDYFLLDGEDPAGCECEGAGDEFAGEGLDKEKWHAIVREDESQYVVEDGALKVTTVAGDIYTNGDPAPTRNFILQDAPEGDWVIETRVGGTMSGGYEQGGIMVRLDDDNYIKYDLISDDGQTIKNRIELRSEVAGAIQDPQPQVTKAAPGYDAVSLRLTKTGNSYAGEYSEDGETWLSVGEPVTNPSALPQFGLFTLGVNSPGGQVLFDYFSVNGSTGCEEPPPTNRRPVIESASATPSTGFAPLEVDFAVTAADPDEDPLTYSWDFDGDGTEDSTEEDPTHTYTTGGDFEAEVTVSDGEAESTRTVPVNVFGDDDPEARFRVLVFSKTAGFRHSSIGPGHAAIEQLGVDNDFQVDHTEEASLFTDEVLERYDSVVWLSTTGDVLNADQQAAFERYIKAGGGYTGIHAAADTEYDWKWYGNLVGAYFKSHPPGTPAASVDVEDTDDHSTQGLPVRWDRVDEWYNYRAVNFEETDSVDYSPRGEVHVLASVDETTYDEQDENATDDDHPISWCQRYDGGRSWYTGMGHTDESFSEEPYLSHILGGIEVSAGAAESEECGEQAGGAGAPTVEGFADPTSGSAPLQVRFSATGLDPDGGRVTYMWEFGDGTRSFSRAARHTYDTPGTYTATVTATDREGKEGTDTVEIEVAGNQPPTVTATADPATGTAPLKVRFRATGTDPDGRANRIQYAWDFGDDGTSFERNPRHTYTVPGTYTATVTATDEDGEEATDEVEVVVANPPGNTAPTVQAAADPRSGTAPLRVRFTSSQRDADGDRLSSVWDFGNGVKAGGRNATYTYTQPGVYDAVVTVTDPDGATGTATVRVTVGAAGALGRSVAPPAALQAPAGDTAGESGDTAGESASSFGVSLAGSAKVRRVMRRGLRYKVSCGEACRVASVMRLAGRRLGRAKARTIRAGASRTIVIRLDRKVRRQLAKAMRKAGVRQVEVSVLTKVRTAEGTRTIRDRVTLER